MRRKLWFKFYPQDWLADPELRTCTLAEKGLLIDLMSLAHSGDPYGHCTNGARRITTKVVSKLTRAGPKRVQSLLDALLLKGRIALTDDGTIYIPRMVKDQAYHDKQAVYGSQGGNPTLIGGVKGSDKAGVKPEKRREESEKDKSKRASPFTPPSPDEVEAYSKEIEYPLPGQAWCDAYAQKGWCTSKGNKMKDWRAAVRHWKNNGYKLGEQKGHKWIDRG